MNEVVYAFFNSVLGRPLELNYAGHAASLSDFFTISTGV